MPEIDFTIKVMPFGQYKGNSFKEIPVNYLRWLATTKDMREDVKFAARKELKRLLEPIRPPDPRFFHIPDNFDEEDLYTLRMESMF